MFKAARDWRLFLYAPLLGASLAYAAPTVTGMSGTASDGATISISGSAFGTKSAAAPFYWGDFESATVGQTAFQAGLDNLGSDLIALPYVSSDRPLGGKKSLRMDYLVNKDSLFPRVGKGGLNATEVYVSVWMYWLHTAGSGGSPFIFKVVRGGANPPYSGDPRFYETIRPDNSGGVTWGDRGSVDSTGVPTYDDTFNAGQNSGAWHHMEYYYKLSTPGVADGVYQTWVDGVLNANITNTMSRAAGNSALINYVMSPYDGIDSYGVTNAYSVWVDDFYIDTTRARVEIGDAATLASCKTRFVQPATKWTDSSISVSLSLNTFASGSKVYLYVFDSKGNVNAQGYPVTVGAAGTTPPPAVVPDAPVLTVK
jgi:hypothetical protein